MTNREKAICEVYTGICFCAGEKREHVYKYASELMGRPVYTHEFYNLAAELKERAREDFVAICQDRYQEPKPVRTCETCRYQSETVECACCVKLSLWDAKKGVIT